MHTIPKPTEEVKFSPPKAKKQKNQLRARKFAHNPQSHVGGQTCTVPLTKVGGQNCSVPPRSTGGQNCTVPPRPWKQTSHHGESNRFEPKWQQTSFGSRLLLQPMCPIPSISISPSPALFPQIFCFAQPKICKRRKPATLSHVTSRAR